MEYKHHLSGFSVAHEIPRVVFGFLYLPTRDFIGAKFQDINNCSNAHWNPFSPHQWFWGPRLSLLCASLLAFSCRRFLLIPPIYVATLDHASTFYNAKNGMARTQCFPFSCWTPKYYRRALSDNEKKCYIDAIKCLQTLPVRNTSRPASWTRFDEFISTHADLSLGVHYVVSVFSSWPALSIWSIWKGHFLPWHRLFIKSYENALRNECGYQGAQPYVVFPLLVTGYEYS